MGALTLNISFERGLKRDIFSHLDQKFCRDNGLKGTKNGKKKICKSNIFS